MIELTCSIAKGKGSLNHNNRSFSAVSVDPDLTKRNFVLVDESLEDTYHQLFDKAVAVYNAKQTRDDRKISSYLEKIQRSKQEKPFYEIVVEIGSTADIAKGSPEEDQCRQALDDYVRTFQERNPAFKVFQAIRHEDEPAGLCHYHIDFVPVSTGNKRGLETKTSLSGAFAAMGFGRNGFTEWRNREQTELIRCMQQHKIAYRAGDGRSVHLTASEMREVGRQQAELPEFQPETGHFGRKTGNMVISAADAEKLLKTAKNGILDQAVAEKLEKKDRQLSDLAAELTAKEKSLSDREASLEAQKRALEAQERRADVQAVRKENEALRASNRALTARCSTLQEENDRLQRLFYQYVAKIHEIAEGIGYAARRFFSLEGPNGKTFDDASYPDEPSDRVIDAIENPLEEPVMEKDRFMERE